jgi:hypothetical protein
MTRLGMGLALGQGARRFDPASLFAGGEAGAWYDPSDLSAMFQDDAGTVPAAVDMPVGRLLDRSGRGNHAVQANAAARPMLRQSGAGRLFLEFDGVDDQLVAAFSISQPIERVSAIRQLAWTTSGRIFASSSVNAGALYMAGTAPRLGLYSGIAGISTGAVAVGADAVIAERHHEAASRITVNGDAPVTGAAGAVAPDGLTIGGWGSFRSQVRVYGVLMIGRLLSEAEGARLRGFMAARAGVPV